MRLIHPDWPAPPGVSALVTTRNFGDMARDSRARAELRALVPSEPVWMRQVHGVQVIDLDRPAGAEPQADAAVARTGARVCAVTVADCMPVFLTDGSTVGVAHAGWRGLANGVLEATVTAMQANPERLLAWLGPAIGPRNYEVGEDVRTAFVSRDRAAAAAFVAARPGHWLLDLYAIARQRLAASGVMRIYGGGFCTYSEKDRFFSYRREHTASRMAAAIWLA